MKRREKFAVLNMFEVQARYRANIQVRKEEVETYIYNRYGNKEGGPRDRGGNKAWDGTKVDPGGIGGRQHPVEGNKGVRWSGVKVFIMSSAM